MKNMNLGNSLLSSWITNYEEPTPVDFIKYPIQNENIIVSWRRHIDISDAWMAIGENIFIFKEYFYCTNCKSWITFRSTNYYVVRHSKTHKTLKIGSFGDESTGSTIIKISNPVMNFIKKNLKTYLILSGAPFSHIENPYLRSICPQLPSRETYTKEIEQIAEDIRKSIKLELLNCNTICVSFDEWSDSSRKRYLGLTAIGVNNDRVITYSLSLIPLVEDPVSGSYIANCVDKELKKYSIDTKVTVIITDSGAPMIAASKFLPYQRLPCICHVFNLMISAFMKAESDIVDTFNYFQKEFSTSKFVSFSERMGAPLLKVQSYISVRWYSFYNLLLSLRTLKPTIERYCHEEKKTIIKPENWITLDNLIPFFKTFTTCIKEQESDRFGNISLVLKHFIMLEKKAEKLSHVFLKGKRAFNEKKIEYFTRYENIWSPLLYAATRLNPSLNVQEILLPSEVEKADKLILEKLEFFIGGKEKTQDNNEDSDDIFGYNSPNSNRSHIQVFQEYQMLPQSKECDLFLFWKNSYNTKLHPLAKVAFEILSIVVTSASTEREFSTCRRFLGFHRLSLSQDHIEDIALILGNPLLALENIK